MKKSSLLLSLVFSLLMLNSCNNSSSSESNDLKVITDEFVMSYYWLNDGTTLYALGPDSSVMTCNS